MIAPVDLSAIKHYIPARTEDLFLPQTPRGHALRGMVNRRSRRDFRSAIAFLYLPHRPCVALAPTIFISFGGAKMGVQPEDFPGGHPS